MTTDAILARLTEIAAETERHATAIWLLEREREELRRWIKQAELAGKGAANA